MIDYNNAKIYTIKYKNDASLIYVGSTTQILSKRFTEHKSYYNKGDERSLLYLKMKETNDIDNWYIELYENYSCNNKEELHKKEGEVIKEIGTLNKLVSGRTRKEYYNDNKDKWEVYNSNEYREKNRERIREAQRKYSRKECNYDVVNCVCGCNVKKHNLSRHKKTDFHINYCIPI